MMAALNGRHGVADGVGRWPIVLAGLVVALGFGVAGCSGEEAVEPAADVAPIEANAMPTTVAQEPAAEPTEAMAADEAAAGPSQGGVMAFVIVPEESRAGYVAQEEFFSGAVERLGKALGLVEPVGVASGVQGNLDLQLDGAPQVVGGKLVVDLRGLTSDDERRDNRIREEWLESNLYPEATFVVTGAQDLPETFEPGQPVEFTLLGDLTVRGVTQPVAWDVTAVIEDDRLTGTATTEILMSDFGMQPPNMANMFTVQDNLTLTADLVATAPMQ